MARYRSALLQELAAQLVRGPNKLKWRQTVGAERLFRIINLQADYPYDLVTDHITGYRSRERNVQRPLIAGRDLLHDLPVLIDEVSQSAPAPAERVRGPGLCTIEDLAQRFGVSTKTVNRWRTDGLIGRKVRFGDGKTRVAFLADSVEFFVGTRDERVRRGREFSRLSSQERQEVLRRAGRMARRGSRQQVIERIAKRMGRSIETIRYVISAWDEQHPTRALFPDRRRNFSPEQFQQIFDGWRGGAKPKELAGRFGCAPSTIYRAICQMRFEELRKRRPDFVPHGSFARPGVEAEILRGSASAGPGKGGNGGELEQPPRALAARASPPANALPYLRDLWGGELLTAEQEAALFRRYNFLKFLSAREIDAVESPALVSGSRLDRIEQWLAWAEKVRDRLIRANLRLVVSIAKKHYGPMTQLLELVSDGNMVLMRAIEKFDFARGQKFST